MKPRRPTGDEGARRGRVTVGSRNHRFLTSERIRSSCCNVTGGTERSRDSSSDSFNGNRWSDASEDGTNWRPNGGPKRRDGETESNETESRPGRPGAFPVRHPSVRTSRRTSSRAGAGGRRYRTRYEPRSNGSSVPVSATFGFTREPTPPTRRVERTLAPSPWGETSTSVRESTDRLRPGVESCWHTNSHTSSNSARPLTSSNASPKASPRSRDRAHRRNRPTNGGWCPPRVHRVPGCP
ncbi:hypothetical protein SAMN04487947_3541 [Halogeometricum rufum]|uniref:Uncharacterized protein n=1 Tax=Halogeometricum rufum TaxID=553469 RepID=A0A1I6IQJ1_9EURY|nr:hypothetical protein SAMN04487947_3541 [Halogeometricum rufum]